MPLKEKKKRTNNNNNNKTPFISLLIPVYEGEKFSLIFFPLKYILSSCYFIHKYLYQNIYKVKYNFYFPSKAFIHID